MIVFRSIVTLALSCAPLVGTALAADDDPTGEAPTAKPRGTYVVADPDLVDVVEPTSHTSNLIYLNGCFNPGDCDLTRGAESSINNSSSILQNGAAQIPPFNAGPVAWDAVVQCVRETYAPFNIEITDQDPGNQSHFEAIVAGSPQDAGFPNGVGGVAPFSCGVINNAITYSFANIYGGDIDQICWTVAQETAHAWGLDHELLCEDPMTYLNDCAPRKVFTDVDAPCGEFSARSCMCPGPNTQNSYRRIVEHFGPGQPTPPTVSITHPAEGASVDAGFPIRANAEDDIRVARVEFYINGQYIGAADTSPWVFNAPVDLSDGRMTVEVKAIDNYDFSATDSVEVVQGEPCGSADDCRGDGETCVDGRCVPGPGSPGGLGEECGSNPDCASNLCGEGADGRFCAERCELGAGGCPSGFGCLDVGGYGVCWAGHDDGSGGGCYGCRAGSDDSGWPLGLVGLAVGALVFRRRRPRA